MKQEDEGEPFDEKRQRLVAQRHEPHAEAMKLDARTVAKPKELGYGA